MKGSPNATRPRSTTAGWADAFALLIPLILAAGAILTARVTRAHVPIEDESPPRAFAVAYPSEGTAPLTVRFDGTGSSDDIGVTEYHWHFDDGSDADGEIVNHRFATAGAHRVQLVVLDAAGHERSTETSVVATAPAADSTPPVPRWVAPSSRLTAPATVDFDGSASTDDRGITRFVWSFGDGTTAEGARVSHPFAIPGTYDVRLTVADAAGHERARTQAIEVRPGTAIALRDPEIAASLAVADAPAVIQLAPAEEDPNATLLVWEFGDGTIARGRRVEHRFGHAGTFPVRLTVFNAAGQSREATTTLTIRVPRRRASRVLFDDALAAGIHDYSWGLAVIEGHTAHSGHRAIEVIPGRNGAFRLAFPATRFDGFDRVGFWVNGKDIERVSVRAMLADDTGERLGPAVSLRDHLLAGARGEMDSVWRHGTVTLGELGATGQRITGFVWQAPDDDRPEPFFVDDIALLPPDAELPVLSECAVPPPIRGFVRVEDGSLVADGVPFRAIGANMYYLQQELSEHVQTGDLQPLADVRTALDAATCAGATVIRMIGFNDNPPDSGDTAVIQTAPGVYREEGLRGLDLALAEARAHHLRVILTLTNNWDAFGGLPRYAQWAHVPAADAVHMPQVREWVADYARMLAMRVNPYTGLRYRDDPTILAVELVNELRCHDCEKGDDATEFQLALAHDVAEAFPYQLVADGGEGFDDDPSLYPGLKDRDVVSGDQGTSFHTLAQSPDIDLVSYHLYPDDWGLSATQAEEYIDGHEAIARRAGKVAYLGEFGEQTLDEDRATTYDRWLSRLFARDGGMLALVWQITYPGRLDNDGFALIPGESMEAIASLARHASHVTSMIPDGIGFVAAQH